MAPLAGLTGLYGPQGGPYGQTGRNPSEWGTPPDPRHATPGDASGELPYKGTGYGQDAQVLGEAPAGYGGPRGSVQDATPSVHSAPYPRGVEQDPVVAAETSAILHGLDLGGPGKVQDAGVPYPVTVDAAYTDSPNQSVLARVPGQIAGGPHGTDVDQGDGVGNSGPFGFGHQFRRWFGDPVPRNWSTLYAGERPFMGRHVPWQNRLDGEDSPYAQAGDISVGMNLGPTPVGLSTPYEQPPNPGVAPVTGYAGEAPVTDYGWVAG